jgi:hypothetical protein
MRYTNVRNSCPVVERVCETGFMGMLDPAAGGCNYATDDEDEECD